MDRYMHFARRYSYVWKADIRKYFDSVDRGNLKDILRREIKDKDVLWLADRIIDHPAPIAVSDNPQTSPTHLCGLPLGNQTSQFFANVYLNPFDHWVMNVLRPGGLIRYVDDFVIFANNLRQLREMRDRACEYLATLRLRLNPNKSVISRTRDGIRFLGYRVWPTYRRLTREAITRLRRRIKRLWRDWEAGTLSEETANRHLASWNGHAAPAHGTGLLRNLLHATSPQQKAA